MRERLPWIPALVAALLGALLLQQLLGMRVLSATFDETTHLPSGYSYLLTGDFRLNPQHPPLIKLLSGLPLLLLAPEVDFAHPAWQASPPDEWSFGADLLYRNDADRLLFWGRLPNVLLSLLLAGYVFAWARRLHGDLAGVGALFLCAFSPTVVAHGRLVTFDLGVACFSTLTLYHLWRFSRAGGGSLHVVAAGIALGLALASKYSGLLLLVSIAPLLCLAVFDPGRRAGRPTPGQAVAAGGALLVIAAGVVQASYLCSADPWIYLRGLAHVNLDHDPGHPAYLLGEFRVGGFWYYFLAAFLFKTPGVTLLLLLLSLTFARRVAPGERHASGIDTAFLVVPALVWLGAHSAFAANLGVRYLLPIYPLLFVFVSRLARFLPGRPVLTGAAAALALWYAGTAVWVHPDQLSYFNEIAGGPSRGHLYLDDSNIDWGQDLKRLKAFLDREGIDFVRLRYAPTSRPEYYGIRATEVTDQEWMDPPPGVYAFGTHLLIRGEYYARTRGVATDWLRRHEPIARVGYSLFVFRFE